jgi:hypothetical protein
MSFAEDFPARIFLLLAKELGSRANAQDFGRNMRDSFASFDPATYSWRTSQRCLVEDWTKFSEIWPRSGMTRSGIAFPLPTLAPLTGETGSGLWPTPRSADGDKGIRSAQGHAKERLCRGNGVDLPTAVHFNTPRTTPRTAREYDGVSPLGAGGLNPTWVEWLMGFPEGWTVLELSEMPLSPRSRRSSGG